MRSKYIAGELQIGFGSSEVAIVFPDILDHAETAKKMEFLRISSAGFVDVTAVDGEVEIHLYGKSISLNVPSDVKHTKLVREALGLELC